ncbi:hypothetical protein ACJU26_08385 [Acidithiobacillus sp. M4-SHS-6]|uniref:hypothetical protein n=1 Tax=Acidithiobacillus sp. M4-SHS-6 TaxID=3383024 RepID=UPI0039BE217D
MVSAITHSPWLIHLPPEYSRLFPNCASLTGYFRVYSYHFPINGINVALSPEKFAAKRHDKIEVLVKYFHLIINKGEKMIYALKSPFALYVALRETKIHPDLAMRVVEALNSDFMALAALQPPAEGSPREDAERSQPT